MAATLKKAAFKAKAVTKTKDEVTTKVERLVDIHLQLLPFAGLIKEQKSINEYLRGLAKDKPAGEVVVFQGDNGSFVLDPCKNQRNITNKKRVFELLTKAAGSMDAAIELANFKLEDIDKYLSVNEIGECVEQKPTGPRNGKIVVKPPQ